MPIKLESSIINLRTMVNAIVSLYLHFHHLLPMKFPFPMFKIEKKVENHQIFLPTLYYLSLFLQFITTRSTCSKYPPKPLIKPALPSPLTNLANPLKETRIRASPNDQPSQPTHTPRQSNVEYQVSNQHQTTPRHQAVTGPSRDQMMKQ